MAEDETSLLEAVRTGNLHLLRHVIHNGRNRNQPSLDAALHEAVRRRNREIVAILLQSGADVHSLNLHGETTLLTAVATGNVAMLKILLDAGYDIDRGVGDVRETESAIPVHLAIAMNDAETLALLLEHDAGTEHRDIDGDTALISASTVNAPSCTKLVQLLLASGANVDAIGFEGNTALHRAVEQNKVEVLAALLSAHPTVDIHNEQGNTALLLACEFSLVHCARLLLEAGAKPHLQNNASQNCLHLAALEGSMDVVETLVTWGAPMDVVDLSGNTALILAAFLRHEQVCVCLIEAGADITIVGDGGRTALHWAAAQGITRVLLVLLQHPDVNINVQDANGDTPLMMSLQGGYFDCARHLVRAGADFAVHGAGGRNCLHWAAVKGCPADIVQQMTCADDAAGHAQDTDNATPLLLAAVHGRYKIMEVLISGNCPINAQGSDGRTALLWVVSRGHYDMTWQLLRAGATLNTSDSNGDTALSLAIKGRHVDIAEELLSHGATADTKDSLGRTPLHWACVEKQGEIVNMLLLRAADINHCDNNGDSALLIAARSGEGQIVQSLLESECHCNTVDQASNSPLCYMSQCGCTEAVKSLLAAGALVDSDIFKASPLIHACKKQHLEVVEILLSHKARTEHADNLGRTAFLWCAAVGDETVARRLVEHGADTRTCDKSGDTALTLAAWHGHHHMVRYLIPLSDMEHQEEDEGMNALHLAVCRDKRECVRELLRGGASINSLSNSGDNALTLAATHTSGPDIMEMILDCGQRMDLNHRGTKGRAAVHWSVGDPDALAVLIERHTKTHALDIDTEDANGATPVLLAIAHGQPQSARLLIEAGCDLNKMHSDGRQPLHHCALYGDSSTLELLLDNGIDADTLTEEGRTALLLASIEGHLDVVRLLLERGCRRLDDIFNDAITPLSVAVDRGHYEIVELLLEFGANPDAIGTQKHSPLMICTYNEDFRCMCTLLKANADVNQLVDSSGNSLLHVAIMKNLMPALYLLLAAGIEVNLVRQLLTGSVVTYFLRDTRALAALRQVASRPRSLLQSCRLAVRRCIRITSSDRIKQLGLPPMLSDYLSMKDLDVVFHSYVATDTITIG